MNILVLFSYGSLTSIDNVAGFYTDIYHGHATEADIASGINLYESIGKADPLGANTSRIGRALTRRLEKDTGEKWQLNIANHHAIPSIETVAKKCAALNPKRVVTFGLTPFDSLTGNNAYKKRFRKNFRVENETATLIHIPPYCENELFVDTLTDRAQTAHDWLPANVRDEAEIIFTIHSLPGIPEVHHKMISQYDALAKKVALSLQVNRYHLAYRSGNPEQRWLEPDVLDVIHELNERNVGALLFVEALSVVENIEVIEEITKEAVGKAQKLGMKAVQSEYLNDSIDFIEALADHMLKKLID